jgi:hypothetical protein
MNWENIADELNELDNKKATKSNKKIDKEFTSLIADLIDKVDPREIQIRDTTDLKSIYDIYDKTTKNQNDVSGGGKLPPLSTGMENIIEKAVHVNYRAVKQDDGSVKQEKSISAEDIEKMSPDEIADLLAGKEELQNNENASQIL